MEQSRDPVVQRFRERISAEDRLILEAVNRRIGLVADLHAYKVAQGYPLVDPSREASLVEELDRLNGGPLSAEGLREIYGALIAVSKAEARRDTA
jgi:chorismate mutase